MICSLARAFRFLLILTIPAFSAAAEIVLTQSGLVQGTTNGPVESFLGIPYAKPPVGNLRWRDPQPAGSWVGVRQAVRMPSFCPQRAYYPNKGAPPQLVAPVSEDCLFLNIFKPANATSGSFLPVMVWIHGGGEVSGGVGGEEFVPVPVNPQDPQGPKKPWPLFYDGGKLVQLANVVVVTLNYRLGVLANFPHPLLAQHNRNPATNLNHLDQILALQWVKNNIARFGGNPNNITAFGESAGAVGICSIMASPMGKGLFHKAILQSGSCQSSPMGNLVERSVQWAQSLPDGGCNTLSCLLQKSPQALIEQQTAMPIREFSIAGDTYLFPGGPLVDGRFLKISNEETFSRGLQNRVPVIVGNNSDEFPVVGLPPTQIQGLTNAEFLDSLIDAFGPEGGPAMYSLHPPDDYVGKVPEGKSPAAFAKARVLSISLAACTARQNARWLSAGQPVFRYLFHQPILAGLQRLGCTIEKTCGGQPYFFGPMHGIDILFTFQHGQEFYDQVINAGLVAQGKKGGLAPSRSEKLTQGTLLTAWATFAWRGTPSGWTAYQRTLDSYNRIEGANEPGYRYEAPSCDITDAAMAGL